MDNWAVIGATFFATVTVMPLVRRWLVRHKFLDKPNRRSSHSQVTPRGGGIACAVGIAAGSAVAVANGRHLPVPVLLAALALATIGFVDDRFSVPATPRLVAQVLVGALLGTAALGGIGAIVGATITPIIVNVVNFMDGVNGITALTLALWGVTAAVAGYFVNAAPFVLLGAATSAAAMGFLPWNAPRARIFLGDVGSYGFGALAAGGIMYGSAAGISPVLLAAPLVIYCADVFATLVSRLSRRQHLFSAHREHVYQRLVSRGVSHICVAGWASGLAALVTLGWWLASPIIATTLTCGVVSVYLCLPRLVPRRWERRADVTCSR